MTRKSYSKTDHNTETMSMRENMYAVPKSYNIKESKALPYSNDTYICAPSKLYNHWSNGQITPAIECIQ